jgi:hypothetical protein
MVLVNFRVKPQNMCKTWVPVGTWEQKKIFGAVVYSWYFLFLPMIFVVVVVYIERKGYFYLLS